MVPLLREASGLFICATTEEYVRDLTREAPHRRRVADWSGIGVFLVAALGTSQNGCNCSDPGMIRTYETRSGRSIRAGLRSLIEIGTCQNRGYFSEFGVCRGWAESGESLLAEAR